MSETKYIVKRINTQLIVKLMNGKTVRDMWTDFFGGQIPNGIVQTTSKKLLSEFGISEGLYEYINAKCKDKDFVDLLRVEELSYINGEKLLEELYKKIPFENKVVNKITLIYTEIQAYTLTKDMTSIGDFKIGIETCTYTESVSEADVKAWNKSHAKALRKYLVGLPSVQGVPYSCSYKDDVQVERSCEV